MRVESERRWSLSAHYLVMVYVVGIALFLLVAYLLPASVLEEWKLLHVLDARGAISLAVILIGLVVPLGFHVAFNRPLSRSESGLEEADRLRREMRAKHEERKSSSKDARPLL